MNNNNKYIEFNSLQTQSMSSFEEMRCKVMNEIKEGDFLLLNNKKTYIITEIQPGTTKDSPIIRICPILKTYETDIRAWQDFVGNDFLRRNPNVIQFSVDPLWFFYKDVKIFKNQQTLQECRDELKMKTTDTHAQELTSEEMDFE